MKNEALFNMKKELLGKMLSDTIVTFTNQADLLQMEREFERAELSCKEALLLNWYNAFSVTLEMEKMSRKD